MICQHQNFQTENCYFQKIKYFVVNELLGFSKTWFELEEKVYEEYSSYSQ